MVQITIDAAMREKLRAAGGKAELVDEDGNIVGFVDRVLPPPYDESLIPQLSPEEIRRRIAQPGGRSLQEILRDLKDRA